MSQIRAPFQATVKAKPIPMRSAGQRLTNLEILPFGSKLWLKSVGLVLVSMVIPGMPNEG
jgi:hypothetical protein